MRVLVEATLAVGGRLPLRSRALSNDSWLTSAGMAVTLAPRLISCWRAWDTYKNTFGNLEEGSGRTANVRTEHCQTEASSTAFHNEIYR
jgi:hypothetical protein